MARHRFQLLKHIPRRSSVYPSTKLKQTSFQLPISVDVASSWKLHRLILEVKATATILVFESGAIPCTLALIATRLIRLVRYGLLKTCSNNHQLNFSVNYSLVEPKN